VKTLTETVHGQSDPFAPTHWSVIAAAGESQISPEIARTALAQLCQAYWSPLYSFVRSRGYSVHDAQDLTQSFFAFLIERRIYANADRQKGKFRSFLLASLKNFLANSYDHTQTLKRGGGRELLPLDEEQVAKAESLYGRQLDAGPATGEDRLFERTWAETLIKNSLEQLSTYYKTEGKERLFRELRIFLTGSKPRPCAVMSRDCVRATAKHCVPKCGARWKPRRRWTANFTSCCAC
jgi:DNA-directed RNA polymerase specialized sigma24 family protein